MEAIKNAIDALGGPLAAARKLGCSKATTYFWYSGDRTPSEDNVRRIEAATGGQFIVEDMRADVRWLRVPDKHWPGKRGRPVVDAPVPA